VDVNHFFNSILNQGLVRFFAQSEMCGGLSQFRIAAAVEAALSSSALLLLGHALHNEPGKTDEHLTLRD